MQDATEDELASDAPLTMGWLVLHRRRRCSWQRLPKVRLVLKIAKAPPKMGRLACCTPMTSPSSVQAGTSSSAGMVSRLTERL